LKFNSFFLPAFFFITSLLAYYSTGTYESGDSIQHYLIAKYAFRHPELFLHLWGKPFFTLLASSFAQFGFFGICIFNISCATITGYLVFKIAAQLNMYNSWIAAVIALFTPIYYVTLISGLTEPLFALILTLGIYFYLNNRPGFSALIMSFLPFVRSEGYLLLPVFALAFYYSKKKSWIHFLLLSAGTSIYSLLGYFYYHDLFWLWTQNPYKGAKDIYGSGSLFQFISKNEFILGTPVVVLFCFGLISYLYPGNKISRSEFILILLTFLTYFTAHSVFWCLGLFGSLGLIRVMAGVAPISALISLRGLNFISHLLSKVSTFAKLSLYKNYFYLCLVLLISLIPFKQHHFPRDLDNQDKCVYEASEWLEKNAIDNKRTKPAPKIFFAYPYFAYFLNLDPYNKEQSEPLYAMDQKNLPSGSIILWDSHFGPNESRMSLQNLTGDSTLKNLKSFHFEKSFEIQVFRKK